MKYLLKEVKFLLKFFFKFQNLINKLDIETANSIRSIPEENEFNETLNSRKNNSRKNSNANSNRKNKYHNISFVFCFINWFWTFDVYRKLI